MRKIFLSLLIAGLLSTNIKSMEESERKVFKKQFIQFTEKVIENITDLIQPFPYHTPKEESLIFAQNFLNTINSLKEKSNTKKCDFIHYLITKETRKLLNPKFKDLVYKSLEKQLKKEHFSLTCQDLEKLEKSLAEDQSPKNLMMKYIDVLIPVVNDGVTLLNILLEIL